MRVARTASLLALGLSCLGCAGSGVPSATSALDIEVSERDSVVPGAAIETRVEQKGSVVTFTAKGTCDLHRIVTVYQTKTELRSPSSSSSSGNLGLFGGFLLGGGGMLGGGLVIGHAVTTPTVNPGAKVVGGSILAALGVAMTGLMIWTLTPSGSVSSRAYTTVEKADRDDGLVESNVPCEDTRSVPVKMPITGRLPGPRPVEIALGSTDGHGTLKLDLAEKIPPEILADPSTPRTMPIYIRGFYAATVRLDSGEVAPVGASWDAGAAASCAAATTIEPCAPIQQYLHDFPTGIHAAEAKLALARGDAARRALESARQKEQTRQIEAEARAEAAAEAARQGTRAACRKICAASCKGAVDCTNSCAARSCR